MMMAKGRGRQEVRGSSLLKNMKNKLTVSMKDLTGNVCAGQVCSYLLLSFKVLQLISSM